MTAPIDPSASTAASLLAGTMLGGQDQLAAWPGLARLIALLHQTATGDPNLYAALAAVSAAPEDPDRVAALAYAVDTLASRDSGLRAELVRLVGEAQQHPTAGGLVTQIAGHAQVGKVVTIGHASRVDVHLPPPPAPTVLDQLPPTRVGPLVANLPPHNPNFTGRANLLDQLHQRLASVRTQTLHGLGGVGKTQLALEYAHRHQADYDLIWWVTAEPPAAIPGQLVALARRLGIPEQAEQAETIQALWDALRRRDRWLLVFDNAEDPANLRPWWPPDSGLVLVTSRNPTWAGPASTLAVDVLDRTEAVAFLRDRLGRDDPAFDRLAAALGDLPLALEQAAAYLDETATPVGDYLDLLATHARELFARGHPATTEETIATTWTVSLQRLHEQTSPAEDLLALCAFLAADDIPSSLPAEHADQLPERLAATVQDRLAYQQAIGALRRYSLITTSQDGQALGVHRLVQAVTRQQLDSGQERTWASAALRLLYAAFPGHPSDPDAWPSYARLLPHVLAVTGHASAGDIEVDGTIWLLSEAGLYLRQRADYRQARTLLERALGIREAHLGPDHPDTAISLSNLALVLRDQGGLQGARTLYERALSIREAHLGADHPDTAQSLNDLANVLAAQGDRDRARILHQRALVIFETHVGADQLSTATSLNNLAGVLYEQGDLDAARPLFEHALSIREARLGADHPETVDSLSNLALVLAAQGEVDRARPLFERALRIRDARLGADHPATAASLNNLAGVLQAQGDLAAARPLLERALAIREARLGPNDPTVGRDRDRLGDVLRQLGDLTGTRAQYERALAIAEAALGTNDVQVAVGLYKLAGVLQAQGDLAGAKEKLERVLAIDEAAYGTDHAEVATDLTALGGVLAEQGDLPAAKTAGERALAIREARLGADHPDTVRSRQNLAAVIAELDKQQ